VGVDLKLICLERKKNDNQHVYLSGGNLLIIAAAWSTAEFRNGDRRQKICEDDELRTCE
jgi:hypothetical protein